MKNECSNKRSKQHYITSHDVAIKGYREIKRLEKNYYLRKLGKTETIVVRLDGQGLTKKFLRGKLDSPEHFHAMKKMMEGIVKYCSYINFAYSANDEVSFVIDGKALSSDTINYRAEKLLTYLSGYISSLYTLNVNEGTDNKQAYSFDARIVLLKDGVTSKDYYSKRQKIAIGYFIEKLCTKKRLPQKVYTFEEIRGQIKSSGDEWDYPRYASHGYVGFYNKEKKWIIEEAKDFEKEWSSYNIT